MTRPAAPVSVDPLDTDTDSEGAPLLADEPTPVVATATRHAASDSVPSNDQHRFSADGADHDYNDGDGDGYHGNDDDEFGDEEEEEEDERLTLLRAALRPRVLLLAFVLLFLLELSQGVVAAPTNAIMEAIICRRMHPDVFLSPPPAEPGQNATALRAPAQGPVGVDFNDRRRVAGGGPVLTDDPACKAADVQGYLVMLRGWQFMFDCLPGILGTVPYGVLSDRWGRRPVLGLSVVGIVGSALWAYGVYYFSDVVPLWVSLFSSAFQLIGGGGPVLVSMLYTTVADVVLVDKRATVFFRLMAVFLGSQLIASPLGGYMLRWGPWVPLLLGLVALIVSVFIILAFPETVHVHNRRKISPIQDGARTEGIPTMAKLLQKAKMGLTEVWDFVLGNKNLAFLMVSLTFVVLGRFVGEVLLQYATDRYHWTWSTASMVVSIRSAGSLVALLVVLPAASWLCVERLGMTGMGKDLWIGRWSGIVQIVGSLLVAVAAHGGLFSFGLIWLALGSGMTSVIRSLLNALVEEHHVGTLNSLVSLMETVGMILAGPLLAKALSVGLNLGGAWMGLPFFVAALLFVFATTILWTFRLPHGRPLSVEPSC
ncbi:hypothetical protein VTK26DRAFT_1056 [Humicola hyalothermophila]